MESKSKSKSKKKDGSELPSEDSVTDSVDSSSSSSCESGSSSKKSSSSDLSEDKSKPRVIVPSGKDESKLTKQVSKFSEMDMMKERFAKLLLGEDMSGSGKGVCPAFAISNAITNLFATLFGQLWRLEPLPPEKKAMWRREMEWLLCPSYYIVELTPSWQTLPDGSKLEVMASRPRSDLVINLPALRKLDNMLLEILDGFTSTEFWYVDQGVTAPDPDQSVSAWKMVQREDDKWWLPVPRVPPEGLSEGTRKQLSSKRDCANQILKAAISINSISLAEMEVPESYLETLPKNGRACLGDVIYRYITSEHFSAECLLDCFDLSSEHVALEMANRVEAATHVWRRRQYPKPPAHPPRSSTKSSWKIVRDSMADGIRRESLAERADRLLYSLKQRFPGLTQTTLDASKIQCNKDVGKSILESYSRVLESLAFNIVARIEDVLYVDTINKQTDECKCSSIPTLVSHKKKAPFPFSVPSSGTPYRSASSTPSFSPAPLISPARGERTPFLRGNNNKPPGRGLGVKRALTNYLGGETKVSCGNILEGLGSISSRIAEGTVSRLSLEGKENSKSQQMD